MQLRETKNSKIQDGKVNLTTLLFISLTYVCIIYNYSTAATSTPKNDPQLQLNFQVISLSLLCSEIFSTLCDTLEKEDAQIRQIVSTRFPGRALKNAEAVVRKSGQVLDFMFALCEVQFTSLKLNYCTYQIKKRE